ncbi:MAG: SDR family NAD(P)-dependent oxidoreductase [Promethearchaeota archaeon]
MSVKNNFMDVKDPGVAVITGASSGIGDSFARILSSQGFDLVITARRKERLESLAAELKQKHNINVEIIAGDLTQPEFREEIASYIETINKLDILVNNAGFTTRENFIDKNSNINIFMNMLNLHCLAIVRLMHAALKRMQDNDRGVIFNISSIASLILHGSREPMYHSTKAFISAFTEMVQLKLNYVKSKVKLKSICPGETNTEIFGDYFNNLAYMKSIKATQPEDVVKIALDSFKNEDIIVIPGDHFIDRVMEWRSAAYKKPGRYFSKDFPKTGLVVDK